MVDAFKRLLSELREEVQGLDDAALSWRPAPDTTAISNIVLHLLGAMRVGFSVLAGGDPLEAWRRAGSRSS